MPTKRRVDPRLRASSARRTLRCNGSKTPNATCSFRRGGLRLRCSLDRCGSHTRTCVGVIPSFSIVSIEPSLKTPHIRRVIRQSSPCHAAPRSAIPPMFTPFRLRDLVIPNRIVVSPMCQYVADDGMVGDWHIVHLGSRAVGGAGLVMAEMTDVSRDARISVGCAGLYKPEHATAWQRVVDFIHRETPAKVGIQLGHAGRKGATKKLWEGDSEPMEGPGWPLVSPSAIPYFPDRSQTPRELTREDMNIVREDFVHATHLALDAGFDLLELHMAHGYLLASFISPLTNRREDEYGGALINRMRFPLEIFDACREMWPAERPMSVRISAIDWAPGGLEPADAVEVARLLRAHGCDVVDVSAGQTVPEQRPRYGRLFQTPICRSHQTRSWGGDDGGGKHFVLHGCEHHHCRRTSRSLSAGPGSPVRPVLGASRRLHAGLLDAMARSIQVGRALHAAVRIPFRGRLMSWLL